MRGRAALGREASALARARPPALPALYEDGTHAALPYVIMEHVDRDASRRRRRRLRAARAGDFAVLNQAYTGAANELDITGGRFTPVFASKVPDHRGLVFSSSISIEIKEENLELGRTGAGVSMKIQAKDCAQGGIFQMEPERSDGTATPITHTLATSATPGLTPFHFDNRTSAPGSGRS